MSRLDELIEDTKKMIETSKELHKKLGLPEYVSQLEISSFEQILQQLEEEKIMLEIDVHYREIIDVCSHFILKQTNQIIPRFNPFLNSDHTFLLMDLLIKKGCTIDIEKVRVHGGNEEVGVIIYSPNKDEDERIGGDDDLKSAITGTCYQAIKAYFME